MEDFNVRAKYPKIEEASANAIQRYYNEASTVYSQNSFMLVSAEIQKLCELISDDAPDLRTWNDEIVNDIVSKSGYKSNNSIRIFKRIIFHCLRDVGNETDILYIEPADYYTQYTSPVIDFSSLESMLEHSFQEIKHIKWYTLTELSNTIIVCYLSWLGYRCNEMVTLKADEYDQKYGVFLKKTDSKTIRIPVNEDPIRDYFKLYLNGKTYETKRRTYQTIRYAETDTFIKLTYGNDNLTSENIHNIAKRFYSTFGIRIEDVWLAGRLDQMYIFEMYHGKKISLNVEEANGLAQFLGMESPPTREDRTLIRSDAQLYRLIKTYPSYKEIRISKIY